MEENKTTHLAGGIQWVAGCIGDSFPNFFPNILSSTLWGPYHLNTHQNVWNDFFKKLERGMPGWLSGLAPALGPGRDPGDLGSNPTLGSLCMESASPSACVSASFINIYKSGLISVLRELQDP